MRIPVIGVGLLLTAILHWAFDHFLWDWLIQFLEVRWHFGEATLIASVSSYIIPLLIVVSCVVALYWLLRQDIAAKQVASPRPDMKVSDAIDSIVNDSKTVFDKPRRPEMPSVSHPGAQILVVGALHMQARQKLSDKINIGEIKTWGLRQIDTHIANQFELSLREIPAAYWDNMQLDFHSALFYRGPYSQTTKIPGRNATYNWASIEVNRAQIEGFWPKKVIVARLYDKICKQRTSYPPEFQR